MNEIEYTQSNKYTVKSNTNFDLLNLPDKSVASCGTLSCGSVS